IYYVDSAGDVIDEGANTDSGDEVRASFSVDLSAPGAAGIENVTLLGAGNIDAIGNAANNQITGNSGNNVLSGGSGDDVLDGGAGDDTMKGGAGNDIYYVDPAGDIIDEGLNTDTGNEVRATISVDLAVLGSGAVENAVLLGTGNLNAAGSAAANLLTGNSGDNFLSGGGGNDTLIG